MVSNLLFHNNVDVSLRTGVTQYLASRRQQETSVVCTCCGHIYISVQPYSHGKWIAATKYHIRDQRQWNKGTRTQGILIPRQGQWGVGGGGSTHTAHTTHTHLGNSILSHLKLNTTCLILITQFPPSLLSLEQLICLLISSYFHYIHFIFSLVFFLGF